MNAMVQAIHNIEKALGDGVKQPSPSESSNLAVIRKSIVAAEKIKKGDFFSKENLIIKRPGTGISPVKWDELIGTRSKRDFNLDELIEI